MSSFFNLSYLFLRHQIVEPSVQLVVCLNYFVRIQSRYPLPAPLLLSKFNQLHVFLFHLLHPQKQL